MTSLHYVGVSTLLLIMNNETFELFFSMLSVALLAGTLVVLVARMLHSRSTAARTVVSAFAPWALPLAAAVTTTCTLGSLYFSEIVNYKPCIMCWYQRTMMYPLAVILIIAAITKDKRVWRYATPLAAIGIAFSTYHWFLERFPNLEAGVCDAEVPCEFVWFENFGFVTLPFMALTGFLAVLVFTTLPNTQTEQS
jgi:disulfide bond formation protein DsbB